MRLAVHAAVSTHVIPFQTWLGTLSTENRTEQARRRRWGRFQMLDLPEFFLKLVQNLGDLAQIPLMSPSRSFST